MFSFIFFPFFPLLLYFRYFFIILYSFISFVFFTPLFSFNFFPRLFSRFFFCAQNLNGPQLFDELFFTSSWGPTVGPQLFYELFFTIGFWKADGQPEAELWGPTWGWAVRANLTVPQLFYDLFFTIDFWKAEGQPNWHSAFLGVVLHNCFSESWGLTWGPT